MDISGLENLSSDDSDFERSLPLGSSSVANNRQTTMTSFSNKNNYQVSVKRQALNQTEFHELFEFEPTSTGPFSFIKNLKHNGRGLQNTNSDMSALLCRKFRLYRRNFGLFSCSKLLLRLIPILTWLPKYHWRTNFPSDLMAGFTVGVMHVPQGLAYAMLAQVDAISGIYTAFFPVFFYILLGTSRHISMGTFAVVSILVSKPVLENCESHHFNQTVSSLDETVVLSANASACETKVMLTVTFMVGMIQLVFGMLRLDILSSLLSDSLVSGFTTGAAMHVFASQLPQLIGIKIPKYTGVGRLLKSVNAIFSHIYNVNYVAMGISGCCMVILVIHDWFVKPKLSKACNFPIPVQFILVIVGTLITWMFRLESKQNIDVVGNVPTGMPFPHVPFTDVQLMKGVFQDALGIALIGYVISLSLARIVASKHKYQVDANQELVAQGFSNLLGSFFHSLPMAGSLSRTLVQESAGGKTLMTSAVSVFVLLWVILFIGPLFYHLPKTVLSAIILISLLGIFSQFKDFLKFLRRSLSEAFVWLTTFICTVFLDVDLGLIVGLVVSILFLIAWGYFPIVELVGRTEYQDLYLQADSYHAGLFYGDTTVIRILGNLNMANATSLAGRIESVFEDEEPGETWLDGKNRYLVIDISSVTHVDSSACLDIVNLQKHFDDRGLLVTFVGIRADVWTRFDSCGVFNEIPQERFFPSLQDALISIRAEQP